MTSSVTSQAMSHPAPHEDSYTKTLFGFWVYLMTDCILFASLFAAYGVLHNNTYGGPSGHDLFSLPYALGETMILLTSSFLSGLGTLAATRLHKQQVLIFFSLTFLLGVCFLGMEFSEFSRFVASGNSWQRSGFLTTYFSLVGTHGLHITAGLVWMTFLMTQVLFRGLTPVILKRLACLGLFWHFLDVVWIFIFTFVYLMSVK